MAHAWPAHWSVPPATGGVGPGASSLDQASAEGAEAAAIAKVVERTFVAASLGMANEDPATAVDVMWASFEALVGQHFPPSAGGPVARAGEGSAAGAPPPPAPSTPDGTHWSRVLTTAVTNTVLLGGTTTRPDAVVEEATAWATRRHQGELWRSRRPAGPGAIVLAAHARLLVLDAMVAEERRPGPPEAVAHRELIALAVLGAVEAGEGLPRRPAAASSPPAPPPGPGAEEVAAAFGIAGVRLVAVERHGWACDRCGCVFAGRVDGDVAYPDRLAPVGRRGPCDATTACPCHAAPVQRRLGGADARPAPGAEGGPGPAPGPRPDPR